MMNTHKDRHRTEAPPWMVLITTDTSFPASLDSIILA